MSFLARYRSPQLREAAVITRERAAVLRERATQVLARRGWRGFQGASDVEEPSTINGDDVSAIRAQLRSLIEAGSLPLKPPVPMSASLSDGAAACIACGKGLPHARVEYEVDVPTDNRAVVFIRYHLHPHCFEIWVELDGHSA